MKHMTVEEMQDARALKPKPTGFPRHPKTHRPLSEEQFGYFWRKEARPKKPQWQEAAWQPTRQVPADCRQEQIMRLLTDRPEPYVADLAKKLNVPSRTVRNALYNLKRYGRVESVVHRVGRSSVTTWGRV